MFHRSFDKDMNQDSHTKPPPRPDCRRTDDVCVSTWNINSINAHMPALSEYLRQNSPDILMLQEIKTETDGFPFLELAAAGYNAAIAGQKSYNGVAILAKEKIEVARDKLPDAPDGGDQARFIESFCPALRSCFISVYVPNGQPPANDPESSDRLEYKLAWMDALAAYAAKLANQDTPFVIGGDFNVIEYDGDVYDPAEFKNSAFTVSSVRERFRAFYYTGLTDALRRFAPTGAYSYWDYRGGAFEKNNGILLDHLFLSPVWADRLVSAVVDDGFRGVPKSSDHAPVSCRLSSL